MSDRSSMEDEIATVQPSTKRKRNTSRSMVARACIVCARKKAKCSGGEPCEGCIKQGHSCDYTPTQRRGPKVKNRPPPGSSFPLPPIATNPRTNSRINSIPPIQHVGPSHLSNTLETSSPLPGILANEAQNDSYPLRDGKDPDSGSLVTDRVLQAEGPGLTYMMNILPQDMTTAESSSHQSINASHSHSSVTPNLIGTPSYRPGPGDPDLAVLADSPDTIKGLYAIYWCFVHPSWPVLYRPSYDQSNALTRCPLLHNAIMACCCRLDLDRQSRDMPSDSGIPGLNPEVVLVIGDFFYQRAIEHLHKEEAGGGSINTVQALIILTLRELGQNRAKSGWSFAGQAIRLAVYLNLHEGPQPTGVVLKEEEKRRAIWQCYAVDKYVSIIMGKPFALRRENIETPLPSTAESDEYAMWDADIRMVVPGIASRFDGVRCRTVSNSNAWVKLTMIIERILDGIHSSEKKAGRRLGNSNVKEVDETLVLWLKQAGDNYVAEPTLSTPPHMMLLKLWYYCCLILVHRRHMKGKTPLYRDGRVVASHTICIDAANGICETVRVIQQSYGLYRFSSAVVFIIFQAGIIHLSNSAAANEDASRQGRESLSQCIRWLDTIADTYDISPAYSSILRKLEELSRRELKAQHEVTAILASRRGSRSNSLAPEVAALFNGYFPLLYEDPPNRNNTSISQSLQSYSLPSLPNDNRNLVYQFESSARDIIFDSPSGALHSNNSFTETTNLPYEHLHETFFSEMPIHLPSSIDDMSNWDTFHADYEALLYNQPYEN